MSQALVYLSVSSGRSTGKRHFGGGFGDSTLVLISLLSTSNCIPDLIPGGDGTSFQGSSLVPIRGRRVNILYLELTCQTSTVVRLTTPSPLGSGI